MFANKTRILLTFREDVLGRDRVFPGLKLAEHRMRFANACKSASGSGEIHSGGGWRLGGVFAERRLPRPQRIVWSSRPGQDPGRVGDGGASHAGPRSHVAPPTGAFLYTRFLFMEEAGGP